MTFDINDPTREATRAPKLPMSPAQLDALRPKPVVANQPVSEAKAIAYRSGIKEIEGLVLRIEAFEEQVRKLTAR
jgi:hypothetical protein